MAMARAANVRRRTCGPNTPHTRAPDVPYNVRGVLADGVDAGDRRLDLGSAVLLTVLVGLQANLLALLLVLAPTEIYSAYAANDLRDQQIGGLLMLGPASLIFLGATVRAVTRLVQTGGRVAVEALHDLPSLGSWRNSVQLEQAKA